VHHATNINGQAPTDFTLIYDGACGLCRRTVLWIQAQRPLRPIRFVNSLNPQAMARLPVSHSEAQQSVILLTPHGRKLKGYEASIGVMALLPGYRLLTCIMLAWPIRLPGRLAYATITALRHNISHATGLNKTPHPPVAAGGDSR
jgi:predicted DCC family thiol-disulfide oxidoreductase YuxK